MEEDYRVRMARLYGNKRANRIFRSPPIYDLIFSRLSPADSIRLSKTCLSAYNAHENYSERCYNIDKLLNRFFSRSKAQAFRLLQARTATVISGSTALQFIDRIVYPGSDLDLYTPRQHALEVGRWILNDGYKYKLEPQQPDFVKSAKEVAKDEGQDDYVKGKDYRTNGISGVFEFRKGNKVVQLIASKHSPFHSILSFHSTCVMNFITYEGAYSMYPGATFDARVAASMGEITDKELRALAKYQKRGWTITTNVQWQAAKTRKLFFIDEPRWVMDKHSFRIPLKPINAPPRQFTPGSVEMDFDPILCNSWRLTSDSKVNNTTGNFFVSRLLKYRYMFGDKALFMDVIKYLKKQGELEFRRMQLLGYHPDYVEASSQWNWWDGSLLGAYERHFALSKEEREEKVKQLG